MLWGLYYFVFLMAEKLIGKKRLERIPSLIRHICLLLVVLLGWIIFRVEDLGTMGTAFAGLFQFRGQTISFLLSHHDALYPLYLLLPACLGCLPLAGWLKEKCPEKFQFHARIVLSILLFFLCIALLLGATYNPFIYFRF